MDNTVVITGRNYCNLLTMTRDLGEAGYNVKILRVFKNKVNPLNKLRTMHPESFSKYVIEYQECIVDEDKKMVDALIQLHEDHSLLIPTDDYTVSIVDTHYDELKNYYQIPNINNQQSSIDFLMNKNEQKRLAKEFGLPILHSTLIECTNGHYELSDDIHYPCFMKPNVSMKSNKNTMRKCENEDILRKTLDQYKEKGDFSFLIEEYADIQNEYSILGISCKEKAIAPGLFRVIEGGHHERKGVTLIGEMLPCSKYQSIIDECNEFVKYLHYTGLYDIDLLETKDGHVYFIEINFRAGASTHALTKYDFNLPGMFADYMLKGKMFENKVLNIKEGKKFISEKILMEEYARGDLTYKEVQDKMNSVDIYFVKDEMDNKPYDYFNKFYKVAKSMRLLYKIKK